ncbi:hypothetical protein ABID42_000560 [Arcicella rosea]|uniref:aKG-HExxH-type peptide beta-hydroxylase n=1 Tax=Arcicella rosea TaxID=502909 RepID=UPI00345C7273
MLYLIGKEGVLKTLILLSKTVTKDINSIQSLRKAYLQFLRKNSADGLIADDNEPLFCYNTQRIQSLTNCLSQECDITDISAKILDDTPIESMRLALERVSAALNIIHDTNDVIHDFFHLVIHTIFYSRSLDSGGGSISDAKGVIWCCNRKAWTDLDIAEFLVHELTHNLLFLDEMCYKHYKDFSLIAQKENYALSAILGRNRPLDKVIHSLVVAHEVINFRIETGEPLNPIVHPSTSVMIDSCRKTIDSLNQLLKDEKKDLVTERFYQILDLVDASIRQIDLSSQATFKYEDILK